jgi:uncharacterized protein HemY
LTRPNSGIIIEAGGYQFTYDIHDGVYYTMIAVAILFALSSLFGVVGSVTVCINNWALNDEANFFLIAT